MTLYDKIVTIYPELTIDSFGREGMITLKNDGEGDYIAKWEHPTLARPTQEQLDGIE